MNYVKGRITVDQMRDRAKVEAMQFLPSRILNVPITTDDPVRVDDRL